MPYYKIDYYAFTIPTDHTFKGVNDEVRKQVVQTFVSLCSTIPLEFFDVSAFQIERAKGFYTYRLRHEPTGLALSFGNTNAHIFVELSGKTCDTFDSIDALFPLISATSSRSSRIDIAADYISAVAPLEFAQLRNTERWKFAPHYPSASGETVYIGSRSGERMARVYRYNAPHPRAHLLRVECEYKGDAAKKLSGLPNLLNLKSIFDIAVAPFGFSHPIFLEEHEDLGKLAYRKNSEKNKNTVAWLYGAVISAMRKAIAEDVIDFEEWRSKLFNERFVDDWDVSPNSETAVPNSPEVLPENQTSTS